MQYLTLIRSEENLFSPQKTVLFFNFFIFSVVFLLDFFPQSRAQELTTVKMSKFGSGIGAPSKEERLKEAAEIHLRLGQIQRYCELMVELGEVKHQNILEGQ